MEHSYTIITDNVTYKIEIALHSNTIEISISNETIKPILKYKGSFEQDDFIKLNKVFRIYDSISEIKDEIESLIKNKNINLKIEDSHITLTLNYSFNMNVIDIPLIIPSITLNPSTVMNDLGLSIMELTKKNKELENKYTFLSERLIKVETVLQFNLAYPIATTVFSPLIHFESEVEIIKKWAKCLSNETLILQYKGSLNGFDSNFFYRKFPKIKKTVFLFQLAKTKEVIGGYISRLNSDNSEYQYDPNAFLFSLSKNKVYYVENQSKAVKYSSDSFIQFNEDLIIYSHPHITKNYSNFPCAYGNKDLNDKFSLTEKQYFYITEIEIYSIE